MEEIILNGTKYVPEVNNKKEDHPYVMCRTFSAGVFAGYLISREGKEVLLHQARRIWRWSGAATLSQLAQSGTSKPEDCKFPEEVSEVILIEVIEIITITEKAKETIKKVPVWKA